MRKPTEILDLFETRMRELGMTQSELGLKAFGKEDNSAIQGLKKGSSPAYERVAAMADVLGLELYLGRPRSFKYGMSDPEAKTDFDATQATRAGYIPIPWHDLARQPGSSPVAFSRAWMEDHALIPDNLRAVLPDVIHLADQGQSNIVVVVDISPHRQRQNGLTAFRRGGTTHLAYVTFARDLAAIAGADPELGATLVFADDEVPLRPLGQVVWSGHLWR